MTEEVRERAADDPASFARFFLPHYLRRPFAPFHQDLFRQHLRLTADPLATRIGRRIAIAAPRGSAKSTIASFILPLHDIVFEREPYILLISATQRQAQQRLRALRMELANNAALAHVFALPPPSVTAGTLLIRSTRVDAYGAASEMRGLSHDSWRPTKIILDDAESSAAANSPLRRQRLHDWFHEVIEHLGDTYTHIIMVGTILHREGLLATLMQRPDFEGRLLRSIEQFAPPSPLWDEWQRQFTDSGNPQRRDDARAYFEQHRDAMTLGTRVLWPEHEDYEHLQAQLLTQGRRAFYQEKQNEPLGTLDALFDPAVAWGARVEGDSILLFPPGDRTRTPRVIPLREARRFGFLDSALGKSANAQRGDFAALATILLLPGPQLVLAGMWVQRATPSAQIDIIVQHHAADPFERIGIEGTGFQEIIAQRLAEESCTLPIEVVRPTQRKEARIATLEPLLASGRLALAQNLPEEFWIELANYPRTTHDDALDAAAGAIQLALKAHPTQQALTIAPRPRRMSVY